MTPDTGADDNTDRWIGHVDSVDANGISGWAADRQNLSKRVVIELSDSKGLRIGLCVADGFRSDLVAVGIGEGRHGFFLPLNDRARSAETIYVRFQDSKIVLQNGVVETDVEGMLFAYQMPENYIVLMRSLALEI